MNLLNFCAKNAITTCLFLFLYFALPAQEVSQEHRCGHDHPALKTFMKKHAASNPAAQQRSQVCKRIRVYWIELADTPTNEARRKYCDIGIRETQQQWASQGRTAYFENMQTLRTGYTSQDIRNAGENAWFSFTIDNIIVPQVGGNGYNSRTIFFLDGNYQTCCAFGVGGDAGWAGMPYWAINGIENYITTNNYGSRPDIGAIGHELGHAFNMPHEDGGNGSVNCDNQCAPKGIMCNGGSPSPCGAYDGYPSVSINGWNNNYFGQFPEFFNELGGTCNGPVYVGATGGNNQVVAGQQYTIRSKGSNKVLTASNGNVVQQEYTGNANQHWILGPESYGLNTPDRIRYQQIINAGTGQALDNFSYNMDAGGNIVAWANNQQNNQYWRIINRGGGDYVVQNLVSGRVMDVSGGSTAENANIQQWNWNGSNAQLWSFEMADPCFSQGGDTDGDGVCDSQDVCPNFDDSLIGTACDDNNPGTADDIWQSNCICRGTPICTPGDICDGEYGPNTGTYDSNCNCVTASCSDPAKLAGNCDLDGDGILNGDDQDDDNDGILDTEECPVSNVITNPSFDGQIGIGQIPSGWQDIYNSSPTDISTNNPNNGAYGGNYPTNVTPQNSTDGGTWVGIPSYVTVTFGIKQQITLEAGITYNITFEQANYGIDLSSVGGTSTGAPGQFEVLIDSGTGIPSTVVGTSTNMSLGTGWNTVNLNYTAENSGVYTLGVRSKNTQTDITAINYLSLDDFQMNALGTNCDIDGDGISNQYDTDSDNDGCPDAFEGSATIATVDNNGMLTGSVNPNTGVPTVVGNGQSIGDSQNANAQSQACPSCAQNGGDSDNDGICDNEDTCPDLDNALFGTACNDNNPNTENDIWQANCTCLGTTVASRISAKVYLEGYYDGNNGLIRNTNHANLLPNNQPFNSAPWFHNGNESATTIPINAVDWILMVTRTANGDILEQKAGFITTTGEVMDVDGTMGIAFNNAATYFSIHHKSHLAIMSATAYTAGTYDFTINPAQVIGNGQQIRQGNRYMMYSGDYDCNGIINNLDYNLWQQQGATISSYLNVDGDGNGIINNLDYNLWTKNRSKIGHPPLQY